MDTEEFIERVKKHPLLYDTRLNSYRNFDKKYALWEEIAKDMNESSEVLRTKWKGLKDAYRKHKNWVLYGHDSVRAYSKWCWAPNLKFLDPFINEKRKRKLSQDESSSNEFFRESKRTEEDAAPQFHVELETHESVPPKSVASSPSTSRSQSRMSLRDPIATEEVDVKTDLLNFVHIKRLKRIDDVDLLFMSYADTFKRFSLLTQTKLKVKLATMFAEAELKEHKSHNA